MVHRLILAVNDHSTTDMAIALSAIVYHACAPDDDFRHDDFR